MLDNEGFTDEIKVGFILLILSGDRTIHEVYRPNFQDQRQTMDNHFTGMTIEPFTYEEFEETRHRLVETITSRITEVDKKFILSVKRLEPDWSIYDFNKFPAPQWKMQNLQNSAM